MEVNTPRGVGTLEADFVVDASGRAALSARRVGARKVSYDRLLGAAAYLEPREGNGAGDSFTLVEVVASGWWYSARLPGGWPPST